MSAILGKAVWQAAQLDCSICMSSKKKLWLHCRCSEKEGWAKERFHGSRASFSLSELAEDALGICSGYSVDKLITCTDVVPLLKLLVSFWSHCLSIGNEQCRICSQISFSDCMYLHFIVSILFYCPLSSSALNSLSASVWFRELMLKLEGGSKLMLKMDHPVHCKDPHSL